MEQLPGLIDQLGGGPLAVAFAGLGFMYYRSVKRNDELVDRIIDLSAKGSDAMNELARNIEIYGGK